MKPIFDIEKIRRNRTHAREHIAGHDFLFEKAASRLIGNLKDIQRDFGDILIVGARGSGAITKYFDGKNVTVYDVVDGGDEIPQFDAGQFDCIVALPYLHCVNDVPGFLSAMKHYLKPDGLFLCAFFGGQSLQELRTCITAAELEMTGGGSQHIHPMIDHYQYAGLLQRAEFALPVVDFDRVIVEYRDLDNLYRDLYNMGEGNALLNRNKNIKKIKQNIECKYKNKFYNNGFVVTFDIVFGIGWQVHESQQKPAKRGSGQVSLTEIL
jgi:NADH dehydrogenase [ubiquinone] 1 alpha subcomplex assembly factor 5